MEAGKLRHRVQISRPETTRTKAGGIKETHGTLATVWASVRPLVGRELFLAQQSNPQLTHEVKMRKCGFNVKSTDRLVHRNRLLHIESVKNVDERDNELILMCREEPD